MIARTRRLRSVLGRTLGDGVRYEPHPSLYSALTVLYTLLALYGALAGSFGLTTVAETSGAVLAVALPVAILIASLGSLVGVQVSRRYAARKHTSNSMRERVLLLEIVSEFVLILGFFMYAVAIVVRTFNDQDWSRLAYAILPLALSVIPLYRSLHLAEREPRNAPEGSPL